MQISPNTKKTLSGLAVGVASAVLVEVVHDLPAIVAFVPAYARAIAMAASVGAITGVAHVLDAWGHTERVTAAVDAATVEKAKTAVMGAP